jgi:hypothetical protein
MLALSILRCQHTIGGMILSLPEKLCCSSGLKNMCPTGAGNGNLNGVKHSRLILHGGWHTLGIARIDGNTHGGVRISKK